MRNVKGLFFLGVAVVVLGGLAGVMVAKRQAALSAVSQAGTVAKPDLVQPKSEADLTAAPATPDKGPQQVSTTPENPQPLKLVKAVGGTQNPPHRAAAQANQGGPSAKEPLRDPLARLALAFVGADADAEAYWYAAINNPSLSPHERQDLIEDLNEDGLLDPKHPTEDELPLIIGRLLIIEEVVWEAMDEVNLDAFQEAYKDLVNLADVAMGGGEPVR